ncbi:MAG: hypothetical protein JWM09_695 [Francisellaceae bacterium]|nr:hypothetical protein [Francisellaceae bacterium]
MVDEASNKPSKKGSFLAVSKSGMGLSLSFTSKNLSKMMGPTTFRAPDPVADGAVARQRGLGENAQKSGKTYTKSGNWGPVSGLLPASNKYTKIEGSDKLQTIGLDPTDLEKTPLYIAEGALTLRPATETLASILIRSQEPNKEYEIKSFDPITQKLTFECVEGKKPDGFNGEFSVILVKDQHYYNEKEKNSAFSRPQDMLNWKLKYQAPSKILLKEKTGLDLDQVKDFLNIENIVYTQEYTIDELNKKHFTSEPHTINCFADENGVLYTGDWDILIQAHPSNLPDWTRQVINTFEKNAYSDNSGQLLRLASMTFEHLAENLKDHPLMQQILNKMENEKIFDANGALIKERIEFIDLITQFALDRAGCITPYEFVYKTLDNYLTNGLDYDSMFAIQHGNENRNPRPPSNLGSSLGMREDIEHYEGFDNFIESINDKTHLSQFNYDLNPKWPMDKVGKLVSMQLEIANDKLQANDIKNIYLPPPEVIHNYNDYLIAKGEKGILEKVKKILENDDYLKYHSFYKINPDWFKNEESRFVNLINKQLSVAREREKMNENYYVLGGDSLLAYRKALKNLGLPFRLSSLTEAMKTEYKHHLGEVKFIREIESKILANTTTHPVSIQPELIGRYIELKNKQGKKIPQGLIPAHIQKNYEEYLHQEKNSKETKFFNKVKAKVKAEKLIDPTLIDLYRHLLNKKRLAFNILKINPIHIPAYLDNLLITGRKTLFNNLMNRLIKDAHDNKTMHPVLSGKLMSEYKNNLVKLKQNFDIASLPESLIKKYQSYQKEQVQFNKDKPQDLLYQRKEQPEVPKEARKDSHSFSPSKKGS